MANVPDDAIILFNDFNEDFFKLGAEGIVNLKNTSGCVHIWMSCNGVFPECFTEFAEFSEKNICHYSKRARTCHLLCKRQGCYHSTNKTHVGDRIFKLSLIHASVIYQIPWIGRIHWNQCKFCSIYKKLHCNVMNLNPEHNSYTKICIQLEFLLATSGKCYRLQYFLSRMVNFHTA